MLLFFGDQDPFIPNEEVEKIKTTLATLSKPAEVVVYPGAPHGFFCNERDSYRRRRGQGCLGDASRRSSPSTSSPEQYAADHAARIGTRARGSC